MRGRGMMPGGAFVTSLDFELYWGVRDHVPLDRYRENLAGVRRAVPRLLRLFSAYGVHATWATVGFLHLDGREDLLRHLPARRPRYADPRLSPYEHVHETGADEASDIFHFAPSLIRLVLATPNQELGTHTHSHYCCLAPGQTVEDFREDLAAALETAWQRTGRRPASIVFPRNQTNLDYLAVCGDLGIEAYRGSPPGWAFRHLGLGRAVSRVQRALRFADAYVDVFGAQTFALEPVSHGPVDVPASRFLRPWSRSLRMLDPLRLRRITSAMTHAARNDAGFHLWWHPHNFGVRQEESFALLLRILDHFAELRRRHGMRSLSMGEVARACLRAGGAGVAADEGAVAHG